jgi:hypothetical protein
MHVVTGSYVAAYRSYDMLHKRKRMLMLIAHI